MMASLSPAYDHLLTFIVDKMPAQDILAFQLPDDAHARAVELLNKQDEGTLTPDERIELEQMQQADRLIAALKARALAAEAS